MRLFPHNPSPSCKAQLAELCLPVSRYETVLACLQQYNILKNISIDNIKEYKPLLYQKTGPIRHIVSRKEVFQPHLPVRLPCYDLALVTDFTLGRSLR